MTAWLADLLQQDPWTTTAVLALLAVLAAMAVHRLVGSLLRRATRAAPVLHGMLLRSEQAGAAALPLAALQVVWQLAPDTLRGIAPLRHLNGLLLIAAVTWLAVATIRGLSEGVSSRHPVNIDDNIQARRIHTQARVLANSASVLVVIAGSAMALMTFPGARQVGASLLASAGVLGLIAGLAARPVFSNLIAGLQLALAQPLRLDDVLIVQGEWGRVEEITGTYVVLALWDERRLVVPLQWFIENPFQNWTRHSAQLHQSVFLFVDFTAPLDGLRTELRRVVQAAPEWDGRTAVLQVVDATERALKLRVLVSARGSGLAFELGCKVREALVVWLQRECPAGLPRGRQVNEVLSPAVAPAHAGSQPGAGGDADALAGPRLSPG